MKCNKDNKDNLDLVEISEESILIITTKKARIKTKKAKIFFLSIAFILLIISLNIFFIKISRIFSEKLLKLPEKMIKENISELLPTNEKKIKILNKESILNSRKLFINNKNITREFIQYIKPIYHNNKDKNETKNDDLNFYNYTFNRKGYQYSNEIFYQICQEEILVDKKKYELQDNPKISLIIPVYNKKNELLKSLRSIQNQSFKNIEIIIVDDASSDNVDEIYEYLLENEPRIRIIKHSKNMGVWRSRLDGYLYSKGEYILHFDPSDMYADNYVLEDAYNLVNKYDLDTVRFSLSKTNLQEFHKTKKFAPMKIYPLKYTKILYGKPDYNIHIFGYGTIWNRLVRANIFSKALELVDEYILNAYKNLWEDMWWNDLIDRVSYSNLIVNRLGYLYLVSSDGMGKIRLRTKIYRDKTIKEFIYFWYFDLQLLPKEDNKKSIIQTLYNYNNIENKFCGLTISLNYLISRFPIYERLLVLLYNDPFVEKIDKYFIYKLYSSYMKN